MIYTAHYDSPLGGLFLAADEEGLTGLWFEDAAHFADGLPIEREETETPVLAETKKWLDLYFSGQEPEFLPKLHPMGSKFRQEVWALLREIPYGRTTTYGALAQELAQRQGRTTVSAQAVGGAIGHNRISILIPCHRVVGSSGSLTGYAGGLEKKVQLLKLEGIATERFYWPEKKAGSCGEKEINCTQTTKDKRKGGSLWQNVS